MFSNFEVVLIAVVSARRAESSACESELSSSGPQQQLSQLRSFFVSDRAEEKNIYTIHINELPAALLTTGGI